MTEEWEAQIATYVATSNSLEKLHELTVKLRECAKEAAKEEIRGILRTEEYIRDPVIAVEMYGERLSSEKEITEFVEGSSTTVEDIVALARKLPAMLKFARSEMARQIELARQVRLARQVERDKIQ